MTRWQALDTLQQAGVSRFDVTHHYPTMGKDDFHELLSYFRALGEVVVFHEPINPRGANFQQCLDAAHQAGYNDVVEELQGMQESHQYWVKYALNQLNTVQQVATRSTACRCIPSLMTNSCAQSAADSAQNSKRCNRLSHLSQVDTRSLLTALNAPDSLVQVRLQLLVAAVQITAVHSARQQRPVRILNQFLS